VTQL